MSVKEVKEIVRKARQAGFQVEDKGTHFRITSRTGAIETIHKTVEGSVSIRKAVANVTKFMREQGLQKERDRNPKPFKGNGIQGGECVDCGMLPEQPHKPDCSYNRQEATMAMATEEQTTQGVEVHFSCEKCGELFTGSDRQTAALAKARHVRKEHPGPQKDYTCDIPGCGFVSHSGQGLSLHKRRKHGDLAGAVAASPVKVTHIPPATPEGAAKLILRDVTSLAEILGNVAATLSKVPSVMEELIQENTRLRKENSAIQDLLSRGIEKLGS